LYAEMCEERDRIIAEERAELEVEQRRINDAILAEKRRLRLIEKARKERVDAVFNAVVLVVGACISVAIICGIIWMFHQGGRL